MARLFLGLVHYPVYNKRKEVIATSITNLDIHDIARTVATYNLENYYLIHPAQNQHIIIQEILDYWQKGYGSIYNPDRKIALEKVLLRESIEQVKNEIKNKFAQDVKIVITDAKEHTNSIGYKDFREKIVNTEESYLLLFGTGWGIIKEEMAKADYILHPIRGAGDYNHLSVRSAVAIILDRISGEKWW